MTYHGREGLSVIFNGSIFNWPELRRELEDAGYRFVTQTDTEMLLAAYDKWGTDCVTRFNGFWAFTLLDTRPGQPPRLFVSRDRFGIKPLYFTINGSRAIFASEIGAISAYLAARPRIDLPELARHLVYQRSDDSGRTIYRDIDEFEPAHAAILDLLTCEWKCWRYWTPNRANRFEGDDAATLDRFIELFEDSVGIRLRADREVALTLSGGIDSSAIAVAISRSSGVRVRAFTSHFPDRAEIDETTYASIVTKKLGMEHTFIQPDLRDITSDERQLTRHLETLYGSFSLLVNWAVVREIQRSGVRVFLTGQGGDEMFVGYERYYVPLLRSLLRTDPFAVPSAIVEMGANSRLGVVGITHYIAYFSNTWIRDRRYRKDAAMVYAPSVLAATHDGSKPLPADMFDMQMGEVCGSQLRHLLRYDDRVAAAFGTEGRPAFLDHRLVEFAMALDWRHKIRGGWTKYLLRRYLDRMGLPEIAWRRNKLGYNAPTGDWTSQLLPQMTPLAAQPGSEYLRSGLTPQAIPDRMRFPVYNLMSTARAMDWAD
jgi:asparagine synthase (glutamine-hydrolysing)